VKTKALFYHRRQFAPGQDTTTFEAWSGHNIGRPNQVLARCRNQ